MNNNFILYETIKSLRLGNVQQIEIYLRRLLEKRLKNTSAHDRAELDVIIIKALRYLNRIEEAVQICESSLNAINSTPNVSSELLSALKRLRALLYLDTGELTNARSLIEETDGLELILQDNRTIVTRKDSDVSLETWLTSIEIALAQKDLTSAEKFFAKAINRLSVEETILRRHHLSLIEHNLLKQHYQDLDQTLNLYALTLRLCAGEQGVEKDLQDFCKKIENKNRNYLKEKSLPNIPLHSKLLCLLGQWDSDSAPPRGLSTPEALRWLNFRNLKNESPTPSTPSTPSTLSKSEQSVTTPPSTNKTTLAKNQDSAAISTLTEAIDRMTKIFSQVGEILPQFIPKKVNYSQRGFGGHLLDTDLFTLLHNIKKLKFTGYLKLVWSPDLFQAPIIKGLLPEILRSGEVILYTHQGYIIDCVFKEQTQKNTASTAQENFLLVVRICFSIMTDDTCPDITAQAIPAPEVSLRPPLLQITEKHLFGILTDLEEAAAGIKKAEEVESTSSCRKGDEKLVKGKVKEVKEEDKENNILEL